MRRFGWQFLHLIQTRFSPRWNSTKRDTFLVPQRWMLFEIQVAQLKNTAVFITQISSGCKISGLRSIGPNSLGGLGAEKEAIGWGKKCQVSPKNGMDGWILPSFDKNLSLWRLGPMVKWCDMDIMWFRCCSDQPSSPCPKTPQRSEVSWRCHTYSCH